MKQKLLATIPALLLSLQVVAATDVDNTKVNVRDRAAKELTADQQKNNESDLNITRRIRQSLIREDSLSTYAQNIKIISTNGKVTLKGPVKSDSEVTSILKYAREVAGASNVTNKMSVVR